MIASGALLVAGAWLTSAGTAAAAATVGVTDAARFLTQATFGPTLNDITALRNQPNYDNWFQQQKDLQPSLQLPFLQQRIAAGEPVGQEQRVEAWWTHAVTAPDQLRLRMAYALSQILVVSDQHPALANEPLALAYYYDLLTKNALGNYKDVMRVVTLSPAMGHYLSMFRNQKPAPADGIRADENYAREIMQLFSVGLVMLRPDGTPMLDANGNTIPTYTQKDIANLARVFTGWAWGGTGGQNFFSGQAQWLRQMEPYEQYHDRRSKVIIRNTAMPALVSAGDEIGVAITTLFKHPNVGPFISKQLIQRLVTSNPSPAYVGRVAAVFNSNAQGQRGDLYAVARAILLDPEARDATYATHPDFGKLREPLLRISHLWRAFQAVAVNGRYEYFYPEADFAQAPLRSPSVFNFYRPDFRPTGPLASAGLASPEMQITQENSISTGTNELAAMVYRYRNKQGRAYPFLSRSDICINLGSWESAGAGDPTALVDKLNMLLMANQMPASMRSTLIPLLTKLPASKPYDRLLMAIELIVTSPQYAVQR